MIDDELFFDVYRDVVESLGHEWCGISRGRQVIHALGESFVLTASPKKPWYLRLTVPADLKGYAVSDEDVVNAIQEADDHLLVTARFGDRGVNLYSEQVVFRPDARVPCRETLATTLGTAIFALHSTLEDFRTSLGFKSITNQLLAEQESVDDDPPF